MKGIVKWFDVRRGYGFLEDEDGLDYFVHHSAIQKEGFRKLKTNEKVTFEEGTDEQGRLLALNVVPEPRTEEESE